MITKSRLIVYFELGFKSIHFSLCIIGFHQKDCRTSGNNIHRVALDYFTFCVVSCNSKDAIEHLGWREVEIEEEIFIEERSS